MVRNSPVVRTISSVNTSAIRRQPLTHSTKIHVDIAMGIQGLQEAAQNPALLAQLQKDMADPEMMEAAKEMMESKEFKKQVSAVIL